MSVRRIRDDTSGEDLDILEVGSFKERTRHVDAITHEQHSKIMDRIELTGDVVWQREYATKGAIEGIANVSGKL